MVMQLNKDGKDKDIYLRHFIGLQSYVPLDVVGESHLS